MDREQARQHFKDLGLSYSDISKLDIRSLVNMIESEFIQSLKNKDKNIMEMDYKISKIKKKDICFENGNLEYAYIKVDGSYFVERECISFNKDGFIGFGGSFSDCNIEPMIKAFCKWCYTIIK